MKTAGYVFLTFVFPATILLSCTDAPDAPKDKKLLSKKDTVKPKPAPAADSAVFHYHFLSLRNKNKAVKDSAIRQIKALTAAEKAVICRLNRVDARHLMNLDTVIIPDKIDTARMAYSVYPAELPLIKDVRKMLIFSYYAEAYAAYENGHLIKWGPTNMGKKASPTPTGLFSCNWKSKETISTVDPSWILKWNFNISNKGGVGFHQYDLPGYPASHSCLRLLMEDARFFYDWADQWILDQGLLAAQGTPVLVYGAYPFGKSKPWWGMVENPTVLNIPADTLNALIQPNLDKILARQKQHDSLYALMPKKVVNDTTLVKAEVQP